MTTKNLEGIAPYGGPAGGWGALRAVARAIRGQMRSAADARALLRVNQPDGFDCPGCAWPDPKHTSSFEFCENGAKAVSWEATAKKVDPDFFAHHRVAELWAWSDYELENAGGLTQPLRYNRETDHFEPLSWDEALDRIAGCMRTMEHPDQMEFYTSGRASNEAAFLYQLLAREYGTNNFPDCSNMCHEATSVGLPLSIGVGKGTVTLEDFEKADLIFSIGHNPGTNHPRMLGTLREVSRRGAAIIAINPMRERGLERFQDPQAPLEMMTLGSTPIASSYHLMKVGGDIPVLKGIMKALLAADSRDRALGRPGLLDHVFIADHTTGFDALQADLEVTSWDDIERGSGLTRAALESMADAYAHAERVIVCYGMGLTQHRFGTQNVQQIANLLLLRGNIGKPGAGICPVRGHSNVQGDRTVGITEIPSEAFLSRLDRAFAIRAPRKAGHNAVEAIAAMRDGRARGFIGLGGNLAVAMSDPQTCFDAFRRLDLNVQICTKLNRTCLLTAKESIILPCLGRTEVDIQATGAQAITVEDSMSMVHASHGRLKPVSASLRSEPSIIAGIAQRALPRSTVDWKGLVENYDRIRDKIEEVFPDFFDFNARIRTPGGFRLRVAASEREWETPDAKAHFIVTHNGAVDEGQADDQLMLTTIRSHDQYNTTIYGLNDRYRGVTGRRDVVFMNASDLDELGIEHGEEIDIIGPSGRTLSRQTAVRHAIARGSIAAYYPEANCLFPLADHDEKSGTPSYKSLPVSVRAAGNAVHAS